MFCLEDRDRLVQRQQAQGGEKETCKQLNPITKMRERGKIRGRGWGMSGSRKCRKNHTIPLSQSMHVVYTVNQSVNQSINRSIITWVIIQKRLKVRHFDYRCDALHYRLRFSIAAFDHEEQIITFLHCLATNKTNKTSKSSKKPLET